MGFLDKLKGLLGRSTDKATVVAGDSAEKAKTENLSGKPEAATDKSDTMDKGDSSKS